MSIPGFQELMKPFLIMSNINQPQRISYFIDGLATHFNLSDDDRKERLDSGALRYKNRVQWAKSYLYRAGMLDVKSGDIIITALGKKVLEDNPPFIDIKYLKQFDRSQAGKPNDSGTPVLSPEEMIDKSITELRENLASELLNLIINLSPQQFEILVVDLLVKMGYGGTVKDAGQAIGGTGDGGIDGIIKEDKLGFDYIYVQAKKWGPKNLVGSKEVRNFVGALAEKGARKGVFITTSGFTKNAQSISAQNMTLVKIDGKQLAQYMMEYNLGVTTKSLYEIMEIDSEYFA